MFDSVKTKSRRLLNTPTESRELKLDFSRVKKWLDTRRSKLTGLIIGLSLLWFLNTLMQNYYPTQLRDWLIPGGYLPFLTLLALAQLYLYSYLFLSTTRATIVSLGICWLIWLKLHQFEIDAATFFGTLGVVLVLFMLQLPKPITLE